MKFAGSLALLISKLAYPEEFKTLVDTLGFQHLTTEVTIPRIEVFRDALVELFAADLGDLFTMDVRISLCRMFNYIGGAFIYIRNNYSSRLKLISHCWTLANSQKNEQDEDTQEENAESNLEHKDAEKEKGQASLKYSDPAPARALMRSFVCAMIARQYMACLCSSLLDKFIA